MEEGGGVGWGEVLKVAQYGTVVKVNKQGATSLAIYHNYYGRSLTGMEIMGTVTGPHGMLEEWARPGQQEVTVDCCCISVKAQFTLMVQSSMSFPWSACVEYSL